MKTPSLTRPESTTTAVNLPGLPNPGAWGLAGGVSARSGDVTATAIAAMRRTAAGLTRMMSPWFGVCGKESIHSSIHRTGVDVCGEYRINVPGLQQMFTFLYRDWGNTAD
jgi:hypothetical protein